jgi:hypothetical protein
VTGSGSNQPCLVGEQCIPATGLAPS